MGGPRRNLGGSVGHGKEVFAVNCAACHGQNGQGGINDRLVGGQGTLASDNPIKTVGSFWPLMRVPLM
jgi:S-disulfanyl-L-cysteine oxidoreductase SoxD